MSNMSKYIKGNTSEEIMDAKIKRLESILVLLINHPDGLTIKEIGMDLNIPSETTRKYMKQLLEGGDVKIVGKTGKTVIFAHKDSVAKPAEVQELPLWPGGREFTEVKPAIGVNQGDVVWVSSRSGDGEFFRYLIITPWARKATVVGIFPEKHPALDLNDSRFVDIGTDPETGEELYADISNTCSRGYAQFGEKLMHISATNMDEVKRVMARYYRMTVKAEVVTGFDDIWKKKAEEWEDKYLDARNDAVKWEEDYYDVTDLLNKERADKQRVTDERNKLALERDDLIQANMQLGDANKALEEALAQASPEPEPVVSADMDALLWKISLLEKELECKNDMITVLKQITFKSLKGGE